MKRNTSKATRVISSLLIIAPTLLWLAYFNIDHIPWVSYFQFHLSIEHEMNKTTYSLFPGVMIGATRYEVLTSIMHNIDKYQWETTFSSGRTTIRSYFGQDGFEYGGVIVMGPGLSISMDNHRSNNHNLYEHTFRILDIREYCADTPKNKVCSFNNPFKGLTKLFWGLCTYSFFSAILSGVLLLKSFNQNQKRTLPIENPPNKACT